MVADEGMVQGCSKQSSAPARATLERITAEQVELYIQVPSPGDNILVSVNPSEKDDSVLTEDEIAETVNKLQRNWSGGP